MKSFCIKTNNDEIINYLLKNLEASSLENIYFVNRSFKYYKNVIVHYTGNSCSHFLGFLADILTDCILLFYEPLLLKRIINFNYFYFDKLEKKIIEENCYKYIVLEEDTTLKYRRDEIFTALLSYISNNKSVILDGFVTFRLENYYKTLDEIVDYSVNQYIIEREYIEFINLLKMYIDSREPKTSLIHLVYNNRRIYFAK